MTDLRADRFNSDLATRRGVFHDGPNGPAEAGIERERVTVEFVPLCVVELE